MQFPLLPALLPLLAPAATPAPQFSATEEVQLTSSAPVNGELYGTAVALDGDTALVGNGNTSFGKVYVYVRSGTTWTEQAVLTPGDPGNGNHFGEALDLDGDTAVIGRWEDGSAYVFQRTGSAWVEEQKLTTSNQVYDRFGTAVAVDGDTVVVGAPEFGFFDKGAAFVFTRSAGVWTQVQQLIGSDSTQGDEFGGDIDLEGDTLAIAPYLFIRSGGVWTEQIKLNFATPGCGGGGMSLSGDRFLMGSLGCGTAGVFARSGATWVLESTLVTSNPAIMSTSLVQAELDGDVIVVSVPFQDGAEPSNALCDSGAAHVFTYDGETWTERDEFSPGDSACGDRFGLALALDGDTVLLGAPQQLTPAALGKAYAFRVGPEAPLTYCTAGTSASGCTALLQVAGTASVSATSGFVLSATGTEGGSSGLFFFGTSGRQARTWGNGTSYRCVAPPVKRAGLLAGGGTLGACDGAFLQDLNARWCPSCPKPAQNPGLGTTVQAQLWYSDPANTGNQTSSLSDAIEFTIGF